MIWRIKKNPASVFTEKKMKISGTNTKDKAKESATEEMWWIKWQKDAKGAESTFLSNCM